jgi:hypothetical protein
MSRGASTYDRRMIARRAGRRDDCPSVEECERLAAEEQARLDAYRAQDAERLKLLTTTELTRAMGALARVIVKPTP